MAQLQRIAPAQANINPEIGRDYHFVQQGFQRLGADIADTFERIQYAADVTESDRISAQLAAETRNTIKQNTLDIADPDQFDTDTNAALITLRDKYTKNANPQVLARVQAKTAGVMADALGDIKFGAAQKRIGIAQGNSLIVLEQKERDLIDAQNPVMKAQIQADIEEHLVDSTRAHVYTPGEAKVKMQGILERDSYIQARKKLDYSMNPVEDFKNLAKDFPNLDRMKMATELNTMARSREAEMKAIQKEAAAQVKAENLSFDYQRAISGRMTLVNFEQTVAARRYSPAEANSLKAAMEEGGITDPSVFTRLQNDIYEGRLRDQSLIANNGRLDRAAKGQLMGLIESQIRQDRAELRENETAKRTRHFSNSPDYLQATREFRAAISGKGESSPLDDKENIRYNFGLRQLWERTEKGESPLNVAREIQSRLTPKEMSGSPPIILPKYKTDMELIEAVRRKQISEAAAAQEAALMLQWEKWQASVAAAIQTPQQQQGQQRPSGGKR